MSKERFPDEKDIDQITQVQFIHLNKKDNAISFKAHFDTLMKIDEVEFLKNVFLPAGKDPSTVQILEDD